MAASAILLSDCSLFLILLYIVLLFVTLNSLYVCICSRSRSPVRAFAWHPHTLKFAYTLGDDSIKVHSGKTDLVPTLKHKLQKNVADLAWQ